MSGEVLTELEAQLKEATERKAFDLIELLQNLPLTYAQLRTSKIRKTVKRIFKKYPRLKSAGKKLINTWEKVLKRGRSNIINELTEVLKSKKLADELEGTLHSAFEKTDYTSQLRLVLHYLKYSTLKQSLLTGELTCRQLIRMTPSEAAAYEELQFEYNQSLKAQATANEERQEHNQSNEAPLSTSVSYDREPVMVICSHCRKQGYTKAKPEYGVCTILSCLGILIAGGSYGCFVPLLVPPLSDVKHFCTYCEVLLGTFSLIKL